MLKCMRGKMKTRTIFLIGVIFIVLAISFFGFRQLRNLSENETRETEIGDASIGFIGCSNTKQTVYGYWWVDGEEIWEVTMNDLHNYDSGSVLNWAEDSETGNEYWKEFDKELARNPGTTKVWWQLCIPEDDSLITYDQAYPVIEALRKRIPNITIYISPLTDYTENVCEITGIAGIERAKSLTQELDAGNEDVVQGPDLGPLMLVEISKNENDRCHPNEKGMRKMGRQLKEFFDDQLFTNPTSESDEVSESGDSIDLSFEERIWKKRIDAAFDPSDCEQISGPTFGEKYYNGLLIDTHYHIANIPDSQPSEENSDDREETQLILGVNIKMTDIVCSMEQEKTKKVFAFFPVYEEIPSQMIEVVKKTMDKYPEKFVPFIMPPSHDDAPDGSPTVDAKTLRQMINISPNLFKGYGEIGLYEREGGGAKELPPDSQRILEIYPLIRENKLVVYFHLGEGQKNNFEKVLQENPDINFIWHGDQLIRYEDGKQNLKEVEEILINYPNTYYGIDELYGDVWLLRPEVSKEDFLKHFENYEPLLEKDLATWKDFIERHPDQVLFGTDRGWSSAWSVDEEVGVTLANYARAFIARLEPDVQEKFAYKNAERLLEERK